MALTHRLNLGSLFICGPGLRNDDAPTLSDVAEKTEDEVKKEFAQKVDTINVTRLGTGKECVYAYGYKCAPDRLKIGQTETDCVQRIVQQINTSTPDQY